MELLMSFSIQRATSDGTLSTLDLTIEYIDQIDVHLFVDDVEMDLTGGTTPYTWEWVTPSRIKILPMVPNGSVVMLRRRTQSSEMYHNFDVGAVFKDETVDENFKQVLFLTQESQEGLALTDLFNDLDMHGFDILNLPDATNPQSPVTLSQLNTYAADSAAVLRQDLASNTGSTIVYDDAESLKSRLNPIRAIVSVEKFRTTGLSDSNTIRAALDWIWANLASTPATLVFEASRIYTIDRTGDLKLINNLNIDLNGAYLIRAAASTIKSTLSASISIGQATIPMASIPANWEVGDYLTAYSDNTNANTSQTGVKIISINRPGLTVTMASGFGAFGAFASTIPSGTTVAKNFSIFSGRPSSTDSGNANAPGVNSNVNIYNGRISGNQSAQTNNSWRYSTEILLHSRGGSIHDIEFRDIAGECIVGHGVRVHDNTFKTLYGSAFHLSMNDDSLAHSSCAWFTDNYVSDVCLATTAVNGHCEGAVTFSWGAGELFVENNDLRNGTQSILGAFGPSSGANPDKWLQFNNNICRNFVRVFYALVGPLEGVHVHGNILSFCGNSSFQMDALLESPTSSVGDNIAIGDTVVSGASRATCGNFGNDLGGTVSQVKVWGRSQKLLSSYSRMSDCTSVVEGATVQAGMLCADYGSATTSYYSVGGAPAGSYFVGWYPATKTYKFLPNETDTTIEFGSKSVFKVLPVYADNAAAVTGGLAVGTMYRTATGVLMARY